MRNCFHNNDRLLLPFRKVSALGNLERSIGILLWKSMAAAVREYCMTATETSDEGYGLLSQLSIFVMTCFSKLGKLVYLCFFEIHGRVNIAVKCGFDRTVAKKFA